MLAIGALFLEVFFMPAPLPTQSSDNDRDVLNRAIAVWRKAQVLYQNYSWQGQPEARALAERIAESHAGLEPDLFRLLQDDSQLVAAYALLTLELMGSPLLHSLPPEILQNRSNVALVSGSFKTAVDLGGFARQIQKRARDLVTSDD